MFIKKGMTGILSAVLSFSSMFSNSTALLAEEAEPSETAVIETVEEPSEETEELTEAAAEEIEEIPEPEQDEEAAVPEETAEEIIVPAETEYGSLDTGTGTNDELLQMYLDKHLSPDDGQEDASEQGMGDALTGNNLIVYRILKTKIEQTAAGEITSTEFTVTLDDLGLSEKIWSAADLGVDAIVADNQITEAAENALDELVGIDMSDIMYRLLVDCPYDLYWFDKTKGYSWQAFGCGAGKIDEEWYIYLRGEYKVSMFVANEYAAGSFQTDPAVISSVSTAVSTIQSVVRSHASEKDYNKLVSYRQEICTRVSYNDDASGNPGTPYGNPWQLIWVFDEDDSTAVVCEGYSKAFKYLCDLSTFRSSDIECYLAAGTMDGGTGAGNHMWNIVTMDDGKNYLVDVTNCDEGSIGADDLLFLTGVTFNNTNSFYAVIPERTVGNVTYSGAVITYTYDRDTIGVYDRSLLTLSSGKYVQSEPVSVTGVTLDQTVLTLEKGTAAQLTATVLPADADNKNVVWTSSNTDTAAVDDTGMVTAAAKGTAVITVTTEDGGFAATCNVTVTEPVPAAGVTLDQTALTLEKGTAAQLTATVTPEDADNKNVTWISSDTAVAAVDDTGKVTAVGKGTAVITVTTEDGGFTATCSVAVEEHIAVTGVTLDQTALTLEKGAETQLTATVMPDDADNKNVTWTSSDTAVAAVDDTGKVTAAGKGTAVITVTTEDGNKTAQCTVTVLGEDDYPGIYAKGLETSYTYTGSPIKPGFNLFDTGTLLMPITDYTVTYKNNTKAYALKEDDPEFNAKKAPQIIIKSNSKGNYKGSKTVYFTIDPVDLSDDSITVDALTVQETGKPLSPVPTVYFNGKKLKNNTDFTVDYTGWDRLAGDENNEAVITVRAKENGNFSGERKVTVYVAPKGTTVPVSKLKVSVSALKYEDLTEENFVEKVTEAIAVKDGKTLLETEYIIKDIDPEDRAVGSFRVTLEGDGSKYIGERTVTVKITGIALTDKKVKALTGLSYPYTGDEVTFTPDTHLVSFNGTDLTEGTDYVIDRYTKNLNAGTATVTLKGINNYTGTKKVNFKITPVIYEEHKTEFNVEVSDALYSKGGAIPEVHVFWNGNELKAGTDYTLKYANNKAAGTDGTVQITFKGNFKGSTAEPFKIAQKNIADVNITAKDLVYKKGKYQSTPVLTDTDGKKLKAGTDYEKTYEYTGNIIDGDVQPNTEITVKVTGKGNYTGTVSAEYRILEAGRDISKTTFKIANQEYTGNEILITDMSRFTETNGFRNAYITLNRQKEYLVLGKDFEVVPGSYVKNINKGTAKVTFRGIYPYGGEKTVTFKIVQKSVDRYWNGIKDFFGSLF